MYKLPEDITENFLKDEIVVMICFNISQIYIHFESSIQVTIEGQYSINQNGTEQILEVYPLSADPGLLRLINIKVKHIDISNSRQDLFIHFENGISIKLIGSDHYESYNIKLSNGRIIII